MTAFVWKILTGVFFVAFVVSAGLAGLYFHYYNTTPIAFYGNDVATWYTPGQTFTVKTETGEYELEVFAVMELNGKAEHVLMFKDTRQVVPFLLSMDEIALGIGRRQLRPVNKVSIASSLSAP